MSETCAELQVCKNPCKHCPFRHDIKPYLHKERGKELAIHATNPYNYFPCHKTTVPDDESDHGEMMTTEKSLACHGFTQLQINEHGNAPSDFVFSDKIYEDWQHMFDTYDDL